MESTLARLREELARVAAERDALEATTGASPSELTQLLERQIDVLDDTIQAHTALDRLQKTTGWRLLEAARRCKLGLRRALMAARGMRWLPRRQRAVWPMVGRAELGVNVAGYLNTESGMGEAARLSIRSLESAGVPLILNNLPSRLRMLDATYTGFTDDNPHPFNLVHLNADNMEWFARGRGRQYFHDHYTIGYWFWELSEFRSDWMSAFAYVDEVWTASEFGRAALARRAPVPVVCMPLPMLTPPPATYARSHFGLAEDVFAFLFTFDVSSQMERKNPFGLVRAFQAFQRVYSGRQDVRLVIKFTNADYDPREVRRLYDVAENLNVLLLEGYMSREELTSLMRAADCYVSLHRSEGFGLGLAEAMAIGKPVIATHYSGPADFMTPANSFPVRFNVTRISRDYGPYLEGCSWAEPDLDHASALMRHVVEDPVDALARGRKAAGDFARWRSPDETGRRVRQRLEEIRSGQRLQSPLTGPLVPISS
jgi:glycosyltransferase involved in cell wall biosynthesis